MNLSYFTTAFAQAAGQAAQQPQPSTLEGLLIPIVGFVAIFYFLMLRPQQKKAKQHTMMITSLKKGDEVVTAGGIIGKIRSVAETFVTIEISPNAAIKVLKSSVSGLTKQPENDAAKQPTKAPIKA